MPIRAMVAALKASVINSLTPLLLRKPGCGNCWSCLYSFLKFSPGIRVPQAYRVTQGTLQYILLPRELFAALRYNLASVAFSMNASYAFTYIFES